MSFKSRTPKREDCIMPMQVITKKDLQEGLKVKLHSKNDILKKTLKNE